jgi:hypothetical protein
MYRTYQDERYSTILNENPDSRLQLINIEPVIFTGFDPVSLSSDPLSLFGGLIVVGYGSNSLWQTDSLMGGNSDWNSRGYQYSFPGKAARAKIWLAEFKQCVQANYDPIINETTHFCAAALERAGCSFATCR